MIKGLAVGVLLFSRAVCILKICPLMAFSSACNFVSDVVAKDCPFSLPIIFT